MSTARFLSALASGATRRPLLVVALAAALGAGGAVLALGLRTATATDTFVGRSSGEYRATERFYRNFGEEPVEVLVKGSLQQLLLSSDIDRLVGLEGCLSGNVPANALTHEGGAHGPCGQLAASHAVKVVLGPGTFVNEAATQIDEQLAVQGKQARKQAREAERVVYRTAIARGLGEAQARALSKQASKITLARYYEGLVTLGLQYGLNAAPSLGDANFVSTLVFDHAAKQPGTPKQRFAYLFPSREAALISVRLRPGLGESRRAHAIALIRAAVAMKQWQPQHGGRYLVTGEPVIVADLAGSIGGAVELLLIAVLLAMAVALGLVFGARPRLLPLALAALATALTFGALAASGASLTIAQVAVLPVLVGLAVDYAIQLQSRVAEALADGAPDTRAAVRRAASAGAPTIAAACLACIGALLVLLLSPVPTVRGFGALLVLGVAIAFLCALTVGSAALVLAERYGRGGRGVDPGRGRAARRAAGGEPRGEDPDAAAHPRAPRGWLVGARTQFASASHGARELLLDNPLSRLIERAALVHSLRSPSRVLAVGLALAALGWALDTQTRVETDITKLAPQNLASLRNLSALERASGVGGEIDLMVSTRDLTRPAAIEWMSSYEARVLKRFGYDATHGCGKAELCPAFSLPDLFQGQAAATAGGAAQAGGKGPKAGASASKPGASPAHPKLTQAQIRALLDAIPPYFSQEVITPDRRVATLAFGIRLMALDRQQHVVEAMRAALHPPAGVHVQLVGLPVLAAHANAQVASPWRRLSTLLAGLAAVALVLLAAFRGERRRALVPLIPVALATGWSGFVLFAIRVPLNPMSVTLGALVIAISTEFSVLLSERYRQERLAGRALAEALRRSYRHTGAAVVASGVTAIAGFGVLALSDIRMLRDFGLVTLVDLSVSLAGVLVALPAALVLAERGELGSLPGRALAALRARLRATAARGGRRGRRTRHGTV